LKTLKILTVAIFSCFAAVVMAQGVDVVSTVDNRNNLQLGFKVGFNNSDIYDIHGQGFSANPIYGPVAGTFLSIPFGKYFGIQPEILLSEKGFAGSGTISDGEYSFFERLNFLDIPLMIQIKLAPNIYLLGGPEYSYLLSRSYSFTHGITSEATQQQFESDNMLHSILGLIFGADFNFNVITLGGRIAWDLEDGNDDENEPSLPSYRNLWGQLTVGFRL